MGDGAAGGLSPNMVAILAAILDFFKNYKSGKNYEN